eukprot:g15342.t1
MTNVSNELVWSLVRRNNCFLYKRNGRTKRSGKVVLTSEPNNLKNVHSYKFSGLANSKAVGIQFDQDAKGPCASMTLKSSKNGNKPKKSVGKSLLKKTFPSAVQAIRKQTGGTNYRPDLESEALVRWSKVHRALRVQKGEMKPMTKSYAKESSKFLRKDNEESEEPKPKGGMVRLNELKSVPVNHDGSGAMKQTMILNGQVPHLTGFSRAVFAPGDEVELHWHKSKDEVFYSTEGKGVIEVDGAVVQLTPGTCVHVAAGQKHSLKNIGDTEMVVIYFGISVEPAEADGGGGVNDKGGTGGVVNALHPIGP